MEHLIERGAQAVAEELSPFDRMVALGQIMSPADRQPGRTRRTYETDMDLGAMIDADRGRLE